MGRPGGPWRRNTHRSLRNSTFRCLTPILPSQCEPQPTSQWMPGWTGTIRCSHCDKAARTRGEGNGTPLQCSCLENPRDGGAWWTAVHGVAKSRTWLSDFTFISHFHALEKEMATHSSVLARDGGAWWAAVYGVTQSWTWLKRLSSSSSQDTGVLIQRKHFDTI